MKKVLIRSLVMGSCIAALSVTAFAQSYTCDAKNMVVQRRSFPAVAPKSDRENPAIIIVGSAAKATWITTKFTARHVVKPFAKTVFLKAAPAAGKFVIRKSMKYIAPMAVRLSVL